MPVVISLINLKGGVAKTTTTVQIADYLSLAGKRVLVIDLDPQANATESLLGRDRALAVSSDEELPTGGIKNRNISQCFFDYLENTQYFNIHTICCQDTSNLKSVKGPDLLPASLNLLDVQDRLTEITQKSGYMISPVEVLKFAVSPILHKYEVVLIDCPPSLNLMTRNALEISHYYLIPVINDPLSTRGLYQILKRINNYSQIRQWEIECIGILITKYRFNSVQFFVDSRSNLEELVDSRCHSIGIQTPYIFKAYMPESKGVSEAMDINSSDDSGIIRQLTFAQKYQNPVGEPKQPLSYWIKSIVHELIDEINKKNESIIRS
jgi:chromosome partitioning protein